MVCCSKLLGTGQTAFGYISSYDSDVNVIKYIQDRSLYFGNKNDQTDYANVTNGSQQFDFKSTTSQVSFGNRRKVVDLLKQHLVLV